MGHTIIEMQAMQAQIDSAREMKRIAKAMERIADALEASQPLPVDQRTGEPV